MRMMLKIKFPPESGNRSAKDGSMAEAFQTLKAQLNPEAAYFSMEDGMRCAYLFYNAKNLPEFVKIHEPLIQATGALVYDAPALTWEDMAEAFKGF
ncbi:MAG TPA: hypothetical protein VMW68_06400 [Methyloceanibacter sp.]|nr:hypothetical protein [Methyloceanibacter sp.]